MHPVFDGHFLGITSPRAFKGPLIWAANIRGRPSLVSVQGIGSALGAAAPARSGEAAGGPGGSRWGPLVLQGRRHARLGGRGAGPSIDSGSLAGGRANPFVLFLLAGRPGSRLGREWPGGVGGGGRGRGA